MTCKLTEPLCIRTNQKFQNLIVFDCTKIAQNNAQVLCLTPASTPECLFHLFVLEGTSSLKKMKIKMAAVFLETCAFQMLLRMWFYCMRWCSTRNRDHGGITLY